MVRHLKIGEQSEARGNQALGGTNVMYRPSKKEKVNTQDALVKNKIDKNRPIRLQAHSMRTVSGSTSLRYILGVACIFISVLFDILIRTTEMPYFVVADNFIGVIFSALCTIAVLGTAILSIAVGAFSEKTYGFRLKEILAIPKCPLKLLRIILQSFAAVILAIVFFAVGFCTTVTTITIVQMKSMRFCQNILARLGDSLLILH